MKRWTKEEDQIIINARERDEFPEIEGRTTKAIQCRISKLIQYGVLESNVIRESWKDYEDELLIELYESKETYKAIAKQLGRTEASISRRLSKLEGLEKVRRGKKPREGSWIEADISKVKELIEKGHQYKYIAEVLGRSEAAITNVVRTRGLGVKKEYTDEYLLDLVRKYVVKERLDYFREDEEPSSMVVVGRFGSWVKALELAGLDINHSVLKKNKETYLYLVDFGKFKKIGITQRDTESRFRGFPAYKLLDFVKFPDLDEAIETEREILWKLRESRVNPGLPNGNTECFISECNCIEDLI